MMPKIQDVAKMVVDVLIDEGISYQLEFLESDVRGIQEGVRLTVHDAEFVRDKLLPSIRVALIEQELEDVIDPPEEHTIYPGLQAVVTLMPRHSTEVN